MAPPKRKPLNAPTGEKQVKKRGPIKKEFTQPLSDNDDDNKSSNSGKINDDKEIIGNGFYSANGKIIPPELLDRNNYKKEVEFPNLKLNQIIKQKSKINMLSCITVENFPFPSTFQSFII